MESVYLNGGVIGTEMSYTSIETYTSAGIGGSAIFDGTGDDLSILNNTAFNLSTDNFTIEGWAYATGFLNNPSLIIQKGWSLGSTYPDWGVMIDTGKLKATLGNAGGEQSIVGITTIVANTWYHFAYTYDGTTFRLFLNGALEVSAAKTISATNSTRELRIGAANNGYNFQGYISNVRVIKGTAIYTSAFTPPTTLLTAITNTSLLTCQSATTITDTSTNAFTITLNGNVAASASNPFTAGNKKSSGIWNLEAVFNNTVVDPLYKFDSTGLAGLAGKFFNGSWRTTISTGNIGTLPLTVTNDSSNVTGTTGLPSAAHRYGVNLWTSIAYGDGLGDYYGFIAIGYFKPPTTGTYTFYTSSDDGSGVWVGSIASASSGRTTANAVLNNNMGNGQGDTKRSGTISLTANTWYAIRIVHEEGNGGDNLTFSWSGPGIAETTSLATYFKTPASSGTMTGNYL